MLLRHFLQNILHYSRRSAFDLVCSWRVRCNSRIVSSFSEVLVLWDVIEICIEGVWRSYKVTIHSPTNRVVLFHKPMGYVVSKTDPHNTTIFSLLPSWWSDSYYYVGRLDKNSRGLLLLVSSSHLVHDFEHPTKAFLKTYYVTVVWRRDSLHTATCLEWLWVDRDSHITSVGLWDFLQVASLSVLRSSLDSCVLKIGLFYGKNRHIRRLLWALHYTVLDLCRVSFGPYFLGDLAPWAYVVEDLS